MSPAVNRGVSVMSSGCSVKWFGDEVSDKLQQVALEALWLAGQGAITHSINDVPLDTGTLRRSGVVTVDVLPNAAEVYSEAQDGRGKYSESARSKDTPSTAANKKHPRVFVSYNTPYAIWLHEGHWKPCAWKYTAAGKRRAKPAVGQNKWLERVIPMIQKNMPLYLARARRKAGL